MNNVLVSVIVATYRREKELYNALLSLTQQTYDFVEIIVVDDNANKEWNDKISIIINNIKELSKFPICYIVNQINKGSARSRNIGIEYANGEYITFLDDDDIYLPQKIEKQISDLINFDADYGLTDLYLYDEFNRLIDKRIRNYIKCTKKEQLLKYHLMYHMTGTDTFMFKKIYLKKIGSFPLIDIGDEFYLMKEAIINGGKFVYSPHCYVKAYVHSGEDEGLSSGTRKIEGEKLLYENKKKYFKYLNKKEIKYLNTRHHAVIAFAQFRMKKYILFFKSILKMFLISPLNCIKLFIKR